MKNNIVTLLLLLVSVAGFSQNSAYEYHGRPTPSVTKEKLNKAIYLGDITPELWHRMGISEKAREQMDYLRKIDYPLGYYLYPTGGYDILIDYVGVEISSTSNGKVLTANSTSDKLTPEQKNILNTADANAEIHIKVNFNFKKNASKYISSDKTIEGQLSVTVVPETEAEYQGGFIQFTTYLLENIFNKVSGHASETIRQAIAKFTINEEGQPVDVMLFKTSGDPKTDKLILDAIRKMPTWTPAKNAKGIKVKQEFCVPFSYGDGC